MKIKTIAISILFVLLISFSVLEEVFIRKSLNTLIHKATLIKNQLETNISLPNEEINNSINELEKYWIKTESNLRFINNHNDMKEVGDAICYAKTYYNQNDIDGILEKINIIIFYGKSYIDILTFNVQNVF